MSRMSIGSFLSKLKQSLSQSLSTKGGHHTSFVIGNESADLDSITSALVYGYVHSSVALDRNEDTYIIPVTNVPASELRLRPELTALLKHAGLKPSDLITLDDIGQIWDTLPAEKTNWTLVDHNVLQGPLGQHYAERVVGVIDHHEDEGKVPESAKPRVIEKTGSCSSLVVTQCRFTWDSIFDPIFTKGRLKGQAKGSVAVASDTAAWDGQVAKLALGSVLIDTVNLSAEEKTTDRDVEAVKYLEATIKSSMQTATQYRRDTFFHEINDAKSNLDGLSLDEILRKDYKQWTEGGIDLGISSVVKPVQYLQAKENDLVPALVDFAKSRKLQLFAVMTAHNASDGFQRQLLLLAIEGGKAVDVAHRFVNQSSKELELENEKVSLDGSAATWIQTWEQKNVTASRKKVAPLLRDAMK